MNGSRTGYIGAAILAVVGVVMLGIGAIMLSSDRTANEVSSGSAPYEPPDSAVLSEVDNPIAGPGDGPVNPDVPYNPVAEPDLVPTRVRIPKLEVDAGVIELGLNPDRTLQVPEDISVTGWYTGRSVPGEIGPSVVVGHVDSAVVGAGVFYNLRQLEAGDRVEVERSDGSVAEFLVTKMVLVDKEAFPTEQVYGSTDEPALRLITCGGSFDRGARSYLGNVIVFAEHLGNRDPEFSRS